MFDLVVIATNLKVWLTVKILNLIFWPKGLISFLKLVCFLKVLSNEYYYICSKVQ